MESIAAALDDLYGVRVEPIIRKKGEVHCPGFYVDFPDDRYIPATESVLEDAVRIVGDIILDPAMPDGFFRDDYIESEKSNLIDDINAAINDKRGYSIDKLLENMCSDEAFGINKLGRECDALSITKETLTEHYSEVVNNSRIELFYCGSAEPKRIEAALRSALKSLPERSMATIPASMIIYEPVTDTPRRFKETLDVSQGKLTVGFRMGDTMKTPDYPALILLNALYGGGITSKLFLNVRERLSLCYYASSMIDKYKGIMLVASGVEFSMFETALAEILDQLEKIKRGEISEWEMTSAKRTIITSIKSALDRPGGLEELYFDSVLSKDPFDPRNLSMMIEEVTLDRVINSASGIKTDSIYLLSGNDCKEVNSET